MLYRRFDRSVVAMQDACPHRLVPLSIGIKEGDNIRCRYHGLLLNSEGQAIEMPVKRSRGRALMLLPQCLRPLQSPSRVSRRSVPALSPTLRVQFCLIGSGVAACGADKVR